jgi:hypothetical protein
MNEFDDTPTDKLRAQLAEWDRSQRSPKTAEPLAPGMRPEDSEASRETSAKLFFDRIMAKPASALTPEEKDFLRQGIRHYEQS